LNFANFIHIDPVTTIEIIGWKKDFISNSAWAENPRSELKKRLRRAIKAPPAEIKRLNRQILAHQPVALHQVEDKSLSSITQILEAMGADIRVSLAGVNMTAAFEGYPHRR
jgi:hypothetical protein